MRWLAFLRSRKFLLFLAVAALAGGGIWLGWKPALCWYYVNQLAKAEPEDRDVWVDRVVGLEDAAFPGLLRLLEQGDTKPCGNAQAALSRITQGWQAEDARWPELAQRMAEGYAQRSVPGRECTLLQVGEWLRLPADNLPAAVLPCARQLLAEVQNSGDKEVEGAALELAALLLALPDQTEALPSCRGLAQKGLASLDANNRAQAIFLALRPGMNLVAQVVPLLSDPEPTVRRAAMLAVGPVSEAIATDHLLPWLHDADADVRRLCESALLVREDFKPEHLPLARLITAPQPGERMQVLRHLQRDSNLEPGIWLRRLSHDQAPEVRVAAIRAAVNQEEADLSEDIQQLAHTDPSPTVRQLARYYLNSAEGRKRTAPR